VDDDRVGRLFFWVGEGRGGALGVLGVVYVALPGLETELLRLEFEFGGLGVGVVDPDELSQYLLAVV
jgi:hypothetical protein